MTTLRVIGAILGFVIISTTVWQIVKNGIAKSNGRIPESDGNWWGGSNS